MENNKQLYEFDKDLDSTYERVLLQIEHMNADIKRATKKAKAKAKSKVKNTPGFYNNNYELQARTKVLTEMESNNGSFLDVVMKAIQDTKAICILIARMVSVLIVSLLSMKSFVAYVKPATLDKLKKIYAISSKVWFNEESLFCRVRR